MSINYYPPNGFDGSNSVQSLPFYLAVQQGKVAGYSMVNKFGYNSSIGSGAFETIWETGGQLIFQTTAQTVNVVSDNVNDDVAGTGARTLRIQGLDSSFDLVEETVDMDGTTTVTTTQTFLRVFRMSVETAGTSENNEGDITATYSSTTDTAATITAGNGQTLMTVYTIPNGYTGYLLSLNISSGKDQELQAKVITRDTTVTNAAFQTKQFLDIRGGLTTINLNAVTVITEKTDIQVDAKASSTSSAAASFDLLLVQDGY
jgi:hypothetical protein